MRNGKVVVILLLLLIFVQITYSDVPSPETFLGFKPGTARKLADMFQIIEYFQMLDTASNRITVHEVGKTTEQNPFIVAIITSEENQNNLKKYQEYQQLLADPRRISESDANKIITEGKTIVMINCSLHASEIGASQMSTLLAYDLATKNDDATKEILDNVILLLIPMHNPDGIQMVVDWYKKNLSTKYEGGRMPWLYHKYVGHDNNRDWYMFTQIESRLTLKVHNEWHPQIVVDMHQMGSRGARLFVPPFVDPYEPNVDPIIRQQVGMMGLFLASELTAQGNAGVMHSQRFDAWTPARAYHHYHGGIRILTECAGVKIATPIKLTPDKLLNDVKKPSVKMPLPWTGGDWTLSDIVSYDYSAAKAALTNAARLRENWLRNFYRIHKNAVTRIDPPFAFLIPKNQPDFSAAIKMLKTLQLGGVEIYQAETDFYVGETNYSKGSFIIYVAQPYGGFAKALLEKQVYPEIQAYPGGPLKTPYDVVAHTLPLLMGVKTVQIDDSINVEAIKLKSVNKPVGSFETGEKYYGFVWEHYSNDDVVVLNRLLKKKHNVYWAKESFEIDGRIYPAGTNIIKQQQRLLADLSTNVNDLYVNFEKINIRPKIAAFKLKPVRLGLYKSWSASMDEGWTRWVLEQYEMPFTSIKNDDIRKGDFRKKLDVLIFPDISERTIVNGISEEYIPPEYSGGIGNEGIEHIKKFVKNGGTIITLNSAAGFPIRHFNLAIQDSSKKLKRKEFFIPGSILKTNVDNTHPIAFGYQKETAIFFRRSPVFDVNQGKVVLSYPAENPLLSGWVNGEKHLFNKAAIVDVQFGRGKIILIGFPALYRGQAHNTFRFLFNSIYYGAAKSIKL
jgi:hypothetical protein